LKFSHGGSGLKKAICELYCYNTGNTIKQERSFLKAISPGVSAADREALADHFNFAVKGGHNHFANVEWKNMIDKEKYSM